MVLSSGSSFSAEMSGFMNNVRHSRNDVLNDAVDNLKKLGNQVRVVETLTEGPVCPPSAGQVL